MPGSDPVTLSNRLLTLGAGAWLAFRQGWQGQGIWTGLAIGLIIVAVLMIWRWTRREAERSAKKRQAMSHPAVLDAMEVFPDARGKIDVRIDED